MSYVIYTRTPNKSERFWEEDNINILAIHDLEQAREKQQKYAKDYIHNQSESGYKLHNRDNDVILITQDITEISKGYIYNSTYIKQQNILSFHIKKLGQNNNLPTPPPLPNITILSPQVLVIQALKNDLSKGINLKKTGIDLKDENAYINIKNSNLENNEIASSISNAIDNSRK